MAYSTELKRLQDRRKQLVMQSDMLRETLGVRLAQLGESSYWIQQGFQLASRMLANQAVLSLVMGFFRKSK